MSIRTYNKLFVNKNRHGGSEKIILGYQNDLQEAILYKDKETYFHIPTYTTSLALTSSSLIEDGATGGHIPAISDRIYKSLKNFGNTTNKGNPQKEPAIGLWIYSWLRKDNEGNLQWMDRYYNPGKLGFSNSLEKECDDKTIVYLNNDPVFTDVPSAMVFEPGVLYKYIHIGEQTAQDFITTLGGVSSEHLVLDFANWGSVQADELGNKLVVNSSAPSSLLYPMINGFESTTVPVLNFNHSYEVDASVVWSQDIALLNEFTLAFWAKSDNWSQSQPTQLFGNYTSKGGVGVFIDTLSSCPFLVIPETTYGHLLFINHEAVSIYDRPTGQPKATNINIPKFVAINSDNHAVVCQNDNTGTIYKVDHFGDVICTTKYKDSTFSFASTETPKQILCGVNDEVIVITNIARYYFDRNLNLLRKENYGLEDYSVSSFKYNQNTSKFEIVTKTDVIDFKCVNGIEWTIKNSNRKVYKNDVLFASVAGGANTLQIDPNGFLWVLHGTNQVSVFDSNTEQEIPTIVYQFTVGTDAVHSKKYCSFIQIYNRETNTTDWRSIIFYPNEYYLYVVSLNGRVVQTFNLRSMFNLATIKQYQQDPEQFLFEGIGDMTGYEHKQLLRSSEVFNNTSQLVIKTSLKDNITGNFNTFKSSYSTGSWEDSSWKHIVVTLKNKTITTYVNSKLQGTLSYNGRYEQTFVDFLPFLIGVTGGSRNNLNKEIKQVANIFNGAIGEIKILNYALDQKVLDVFLRANALAENIRWSMPVPSLQHVEKIEKIFKNKLPGIKSNFFNIKLAGTKITDPTTRSLIEEEVRKIVAKSSPIYCDFVKIIWVD